MTALKRILVANRGEIAVRVMRTASSLGYETVAVYSDADADAPHVKRADQAVHIGAAPVGDSYLDPQKILAAAAASSADAIHPGYGFLSENADFAAAVSEAGLTFIGPPAEAIALMGNKAEAKRRMIAAGVPCVPGYEGKDQADETFVAAAADIGYPIMVKAAAGGGGRGMRLVEDADGLVDALRAARSEALNAFGSDELILEKAIQRPRHVEIQVFADDHGNVVHMGERDCSVQRRHQKVVEEAPCPVMTEDLRQRMGAAAVDAARSIGYRSAGTVEFLLDADGAFYFLEMNTRLQVEHPVTELVTGLDLVALQIQVAEGRELGMAQDDIALAGHTIEVRLYAEDPAQDFLPCTGPVDLWRPATGDGIRIDAGIESGGQVSPFYDPMIAKVIAAGPTREIARRRLIDALKDTVLFGLQTNKAFLIDVLADPVFADGGATTAFIAEQFGDGLYAAGEPTASEAAIAAVLHYRLDAEAARSRALSIPEPLMNWSSGGTLVTHYHFQCGDDGTALAVSPQGPDAYRVEGGEETWEFAVRPNGDGSLLLATGDDQIRAFGRHAGDGYLDVNIDGRTFRLRNMIGLSAADDQAGGGGRVVAPMHGRIVDVLAKPGDAVTSGARLVVLEAMKMQHEILAEVDGTVANVACAVDDQVAADDLLVEIEEASEEG